MNPDSEVAVDASKDREHSVIRIEPSTRFILVVLLILAGLWLLNRLVPVVLVLVAALIIVGTIGPAVQWLERRRIRRGLGIGIVFTALLAITILFITMTIPSLMAQAMGLSEQEPALRESLANWLAGSNLTRPLADLLRAVKAGDLVTMAASKAIAFSTRIVAIFAYIMSSLFLALFIMTDRDRLRGALFLLVPINHHMLLSRVLLKLESIVGSYIRGQVITSFFMATFVFILLRACGVENALAIAVFAGAADVLPYIGPLLSVGAAGAAVITFGPTITMVVIALMILYEEFESRLIIPKVYGGALRLPSSVILFSLLTGSVLAGITGALLALPVAAAIMMIVEEFRVELPGQQEQAEDVVTRHRDDEAKQEYERRAEGMPASEAAAIATEISTDRQKE